MERIFFKPDAPDTDAAALLAQLMADRFSCRRFRPDQVPKEVIRRVLEMAQLSPSWCNSQPWQVFVTSGEATDSLREAILADIAETPSSAPDMPFPEEYRGVFLDRKRAVGWQLYRQLGIERGDRERSREAVFDNFRLFGAPHTAIVTTERSLGAYGAIDCGFFAAYFMLAAQSFGVATIAQAALAQRAPLLHRHFALSDDRLVLFALSFGYPDLDHPANGFSSTRAGLDESAVFIDR